MHRFGGPSVVAAVEVFNRVYNCNPVLTPVEQLYTGIVL